MLHLMSYLLMDLLDMQMTYLVDCCQYFGQKNIYQKKDQLFMLMITAENWKNIVSTNIFMMM